jgi:hypothetical protein
MQAEITSNKVAAGKIKGTDIQQWVQVGDYEIFVHRVTEQVHQYLNKEKEERVVYIEVEYRNQTEIEGMSCRANQWKLYSEKGQSYETMNLGLAYLFPDDQSDKHYFGSQQFINPGMNVRGWLAFVVSKDEKIKLLQFLTAFIGTRTVEFMIENMVEIEEPLKIGKPNILKAVEAKSNFSIAPQDFEKLDLASKEFLLKLPEDDIKQAISRSAGLGGLKLLRASNVNLSNLEPGNIILNAISEDDYKNIQQFMFTFAVSNEMDPRNIGDVKLQDEDKKYVQEIVGLEQEFDQICNQFGVQLKYFPHAAITTAMKLVRAGKDMELIDQKYGQALILYHLIQSSKTIPFKQDNI